MVFFSRNNKIIFYIVCFLALVSILYRWNFKFDKEYKFFNKESTSIRPKNYIIQILKEPTEIRKNYSIFCLIKTHPGSIESKKTLYVYKIWARKCDNYRFVTLLPKELVPSNSSKSEVIEVFNKYYMIQPDNYEYENHDNLTHKLYSSIRYIYSKYPNYDWYHIVDDDAYVNLNNFRNFLSTKDSSKPITFGFEFKIIVDGGYHSGGPGYTLSKEAFTRIGKALSKDMKYCQNTGIDDVDVNACLRTLNVTISPSIDKNFKQRYLVFDLNSHFYGNFPDWIHSYSRYPIYSVRK